MATPVNTPDKITYFAETDYRSKRIKFGIRDDDRSKHMYIIGKSGMGKSTLLENLAIQDIQNGEGICFIDPHGGTAETLLSYVPEHRIKDVIYFAPFDQEFPVGLNVLEDMGRDKRPLVVSGLMGSFKKVWVDMWSARMEYILNNTMLALMETPGTTLLGVNRMYSDKDYRNMIVANVTDPSVKAFWVDEYAKYSEKFATEATAAIQNKVGQFAANPLIRNMVGQPKSTFDIRRVMDERKIFIVNLSKGRMGEGNANLVGSMLITKIYLAAMSRADVGADSVKDLPPFYLYVDEFQSFANESFADILSEARKYKLALTVAHQYIEQMSDEVRAAVFGNVGTTISFRVGAFDADVLEKEFAPVFLAEDMVNLGFTQVYMKLMIRGIGSPPFSATTLDRPKLPVRNYASEVVDASRVQFARPRAEVEEEIGKWHEPVVASPRDLNSSAPPETKKYAPGTRPLRPPTPLFVPSSPLRSVLPAASFASTVVSPPLSPAVTSAQATVPVSDPTPDVTPDVPRSVQPPLLIPQKPLVSPPAAPAVLMPQIQSVSTPAIPVVPKAPYHTENIPERPRAIEERLMIAQEAPTQPLLVVEPVRPMAAVQPRVFTPTPPPLGQPTLKHQPFKKEFSRIEAAPPQPGQSSVQPARPAFIRSTEPRTNSKKDLDFAPLALLKSQPKKDKGPSEGNLSNLKAVLDVVTLSRGKNADQAAVVVPSPQPRQTPEFKVEVGKGTVEQKISRPAPENNFSRSFVQPAVDTAPRMSVPASLLSDDATASTGVREVPESVLMGVLAD